MKNKMVSVLGLFLLLLAGCGDGDPKTGTDETISDVSTITMASDRKDLVGRSVRITRVEASQIVGDYIFWAGERGVEILVVLEGELRGTQPEGSVRVLRGNQYEITGTVRLVETVADDDPMWRLVDEDEKRAIESAVVYIAADLVAASGG